MVWCSCVYCTAVSVISLVCGFASWRWVCRVHFIGPARHWPGLWKPYYILLDFKHFWPSIRWHVPFFTCLGVRITRGNLIFFCPRFVFLRKLNTERSQQGYLEEEAEEAKRERKKCKHKYVWLPQHNKNNKEEVFSSFLFCSALLLLF